MNLNANKLTFIVLTGAILSFSGCDQIKGMLGKKEEAKNPASAVKAPKSKAVMTADTLAKVGDWTITKAEFEDRLKALKEVVPDFDSTKKDQRQLVLEELIRQQLLVTDAEQKGSINQKEIEDAVAEFRRTMIVREVARQKTADIKVTDQEAQDFYEKNKDLIRQPLKLKVREIVVADKVKADSLATQIAGGADFAQLAKDNSIGETASSGGDLGYLTQPPFEQMASAVVNLEAGAVSSVFSGPKGYYIVKVDEKSGGEQIPYDQVKEEIIQNQTLLKQQQVILDYIDQLRKEINVETNEKLLE